MGEGEKCEAGRLCCACEEEGERRGSAVVEGMRVGRSSV